MTPITLILTIGLFLLSVIIYFVKRKGSGSADDSNSVTNEKISDFYKVYSENGLKFVRKLEEMIANNETLTMAGAMKLYQKTFGDMKSIDYDEFERVIGLTGYVDAEEGNQISIAGDYLHLTLIGDLEQRYLAQYCQLKAIGESEAMKEYNLNIHSDEFIHDSIKQVDWYEEKTVTTSVSYGGFQYRIGSGPLSFRTGTLGLVPNQSQHFTRIDRGTLFITNKRIIFVGTENRVNKTITIDDILEFSVFRDGILIGKSNGKKPLIQFPEWIIKPNKAPSKRDHLNRIVRVLERVLSKTQNETLQQITDGNT